MSEFYDFNPPYWHTVDKYQTAIARIQELTMWADYDEAAAKQATDPDTATALIKRAEETRKEAAEWQAKLEQLGRDA